MKESLGEISKYLRLVSLSILALAGFYFLDNSQETMDFITYVDRSRAEFGFAFYLIFYILKYGMLISGLTIFATLIWIGIKSKLT